jgi:acylaminoacyl-peptidase
MKNFKLILLLFLIAFQSNYSQVKSQLELLDIFNMEYVSDPQISPDGKQIIYVRNFKDVMTDRNLSNLWIINSDGSKNHALTTGNQNDNSPVWSHDGTKVVYKSNKDDDKTKLYLMDVDTGKSYALTNTKYAPGSVVWSHDDEILAFNMFVPESKSSPVKLPGKPEGANWNAPPIYIDDMVYRRDGSGYVNPGHSQLFTLPIQGGTPRQLSFENFDHGAPQWSADDSKLLFSANFHEEKELEPQDSEIYQLDLNTGDISTLTDRYGPDRSPRISPDGKHIAYLGYDDKYLGYQLSQLYVMDANGKNSKCISNDFDRSISNIHWDSKGKGLFFQFDEEGKTKLAHMSLNGQFKVLADNLGGLSLGRPYNAATFSTSDKDSFAFTLGTTEHPADLGVGNSKSTKRLTHVNDDLLEYKSIAEVEEIWWESSYDGQKIQGWMVTPPDFDPNKKYPLILEIHGGPFASYGSVYSAEIQAFAAAGYLVLYSNPRGSTGYGEDFGNLIHHNYPNNDYDDLMSGVDMVIEKGFIDTDNLFVTGGSGGGVLTAWIVGKTDRFKAAVVAKPVINWYSFVLYADNPQFFSKYWFGKKPWEDPESYLKRSPLSYVGNVTTPTMLLTGEEDFRTPIPESEQFYAALKLEGVETAMVRIPGASHGIANRPSNLIGKISSILYWFDKYRD